MMATDTALLDQFTRAPAAPAGQDAFTALVSRHLNLVFSAALLLVGILVCGASAADTADLLATIKAVGKQGQGNAEAAKAWKELTSPGRSALFDILKAMEFFRQRQHFRQPVEHVRFEFRACGTRGPQHSLDAQARRD